MVVEAETVLFFFISEFWRGKIEFFLAKENNLEVILANKRMKVSSFPERILLDFTLVYVYINGF